MPKPSTTKPMAPACPPTNNTHRDPSTKLIPSAMMLNGIVRLTVSFWLHDGDDDDDDDDGPVNFATTADSRIEVCMVSC